ncbi:unnamed protein product [Gordionus sp. m RMFG-2023]
MIAFIILLFVNNVAARNMLLLIVSKMLNLEKFASRGVIFNNSFTSVSSCSPSRASVLSGLPQHENGMYGLHHSFHHFNCFDYINSLPLLLAKQKIFTGIIGKKHVGPNHLFKFDFEKTEQQYSIMQIGRNITFIKLKIREYFRTFSLYKKQNNLTDVQAQFFLVVSFHDPHRCSKQDRLKYGSFCERFGDGSKIKSSKISQEQDHLNIIPDWQPIIYTEWNITDIPYYLPQTKVSKAELAAQYTAISRLDQGIGLAIKEIQNYCQSLDSSNPDSLTSSQTLVIYISDNGPPFPSGRTNLYQPGMKVPFIMAVYESKHFSNILNTSENEPLKFNTTHRDLNYYVDVPVTTSFDVMPTVLAWFESNYTLLNSTLRLRGRSLLNHLRLNTDIDNTVIKRDEPIFVYGSQSLHEITGYYPMRCIIDLDQGYKLIHNLNYRSSFPIDTDFYTSLMFQELLNRTLHNQSLDWYKGSLKTYYYRDEWELFNLQMDPQERHNLMRSLPAHKEFLASPNYNAEDIVYNSVEKIDVLNEPGILSGDNDPELQDAPKIFSKLKAELFEWQAFTKDPWLCAPSGVLLVDKTQKFGACAPLYN